MCVCAVFPEHAEADTFFCFTALMAEIGDFFTKKLDSAHLGIGTIINVHVILIFMDADVHTCICVYVHVYIRTRWSYEKSHATSTRQRSSSE